MNDRQRYTVGIAAAVLVHLFAAVMLGLFGVKYMEVPFRGEVLQVSLDAGGGNRGGGGSKGKKAPAAKSSEAQINDTAESVEMPSEEINEKVPKKSRSRRTERIRRKRKTPQIRLFLIPQQKMKGRIHKATKAAAAEEQEMGKAPVRATAAEPVRVKVMAMEAGRGPVFLLRRRQ